MTDIFPTSIVANPYLEELTSNIKGRSISWEDPKASLLTKDELNLLKVYEYKMQQGSSQLLSQVWTRIAEEYVSREHAALFHQTKAENPDFPYALFIRCLSEDDEFLVLKSSKILTSLLCTDKSCHSGVDLSEFISWIVAQLQSQNTSTVDIAVQNLESLLTIPECRHAFYQTKGVSTYGFYMASYQVHFTDSLYM
ncbi:H(+)-transporting V1 sector ATPase subunit H [Basidiobolus ranarum]|uniref:H(+)-transporting V1 sector ATPase subunit H n=1 Tax=Basidiobolus ranarum TaxID=34480 RepID=A0ABR2WPF6_9FUNG